MKDKKILILGAGLVANPLVQYLLDQPDFYITVASRTLSKAEKLISGTERGDAYELDVTVGNNALKELISHSDLVISLLPYIHHPKVAKICIEKRKNMITTSYVSNAMQALSEEAKRAGILILNEIGLDPGIDHLSAMRIIDRVRKNNGKIISFKSYCGGLPAPEANTNPLGYKFSWSPRGVVLAAKNSARYLENKKEIFVPSEELFNNYWAVEIEGLGKFEAYPNRDSLEYIKKYNIPEVETMLRATLRNLGWCELWKKFVELGLLDDEVKNLQGVTFKKFIAQLIKVSPENLKKALSAKLKTDVNSEIMKKIEWLGLLNDEALLVQQSSPLDVLSTRLLEKLQYSKEERDMIVMMHEIIAKYEDRKEKIVSTLIDFGIPGKDTAMARTVSLPAAVSAKLILEEKIKLTGVRIPVVQEIYEPVLKELEELGIVFKERIEK